MSLSIDDPEQGLNLVFDVTGRLLLVRARRPDRPQIQFPLINPHHGLDVYSLLVNLTFVGAEQSGWAGSIVFNSSFGPGHCATLSEHGSAGLQVEPGFIEWPQRPGRALPVFNVRGAQPGEWTIHHT